MSVLMVRFIRFGSQIAKNKRYYLTMGKGRAGLSVVYLCLNHERQKEEKIISQSFQNPHEPTTKRKWGDKPTTK